MRIVPFVRQLATPLTSTYKRVLAMFPIATSPGTFLLDPLPQELSAYATDGEPNLHHIGWQLVTSNQYKESAHLRWCEALRMPVALNRKQWEWVYILQVLDHHAMLRENSCGLGFGCGKEPLSALMANLGCTIVATDLEGQEAAESGWVAGNQHASRLEDLNYPKICDHATFAKRVSFRACNMNSIPDDLTGFNFVWYSCALEHLGSMENGLRFIENSVKCLRPGGIAVHTTEFNLGSNDRTLETESACIFRKRDIEALAVRLLEQGHGIGTINFTTGSEPPDLYIDLPPYKSPVHLRLIVKRHLSTSLGLFVRRKPIA